MQPRSEANLTTGGTGSREHILDAAAHLFASKGFDGTSVRDISRAVGVSAASLYHHFPSKEDIFCSTHERGMQKITDAVLTAIDGMTDPWQRLEVAAAAHCEALLGNSRYRTIITPHFPTVSNAMRNKLVAQRDDYERIFKGLIAELRLPKTVNRTIFRMHVLGALNWTTAWYRPDGSIKPDEIGRQLVRNLHTGLGRRRP